MMTKSEIKFYELGFDAGKKVTIRRIEDFIDNLPYWNRFLFKHKFIMRHEVQSYLIGLKQTKNYKPYE